jgi:hypothetical protein
MDDDHPMYRSPFPTEDDTLADVKLEIVHLRVEIKQQLEKLNSQMSILMFGLACMFLTGLIILGKLIATR